MRASSGRSAVWHNDLRTRCRPAPLTWRAPSPLTDTGPEPHPGSCAVDFTEPGVTTPVAVKIRLKRLGKIRAPYYRIVVIDNRAPRDGKTLDEVGLYHPIEAAEKQLVIDADKVKAWLAKGAQPSDTVKGLMNSRNITVK